jgi:hypothetical protein
MVNFTIANPKDDNNRVAGAAVQEIDQGDLVTVNATGEIVPADASNGLQGQAVGVALSPVRDPTHSRYGDLEYVKNQLYEEQNVLVGEGDRVAALKNGVLVEDEDESGSLTPGEPVYLAEGGGVTQTAPSTTGSVVQIVGIAQDPDSYLLDVEVTDTTA